MSIDQKKKNLANTALGAPCKLTLEQDILELLQDYCKVSYLEKHDFLIYNRCKIGRYVYTSDNYQRQTRRENYYVYWANSQKFGVVKYFIKHKYNLLAVVQEIVKCSRRDNIIVERKSNIDFSYFLFPIRQTFCMYALPVESLEGKLFHINNYACLMPYLLEMRF